MGLLAQKAHFDSIYAKSGTVHTAGAGLPDTVAVAIAMGQALLALLAAPVRPSTSSLISCSHWLPDVAPQLKREWSPWPKFGWISANLRDFSKG